MKKLIKLWSIFLTIILVFTTLPITTEAATPKLSKTSVTIYVGSSTTLKVKGTNTKVTWSTNNKKIATVSTKGKVTAKKAGTATITAKFGKKSLKCKVTVKKPYISDTKKTLTVGKSYTLKLKGTDIVSAKTSNSKVATVNKSGKVTAKKTGTATITLNGKDGKNYTCKITVQKASSEKKYICNTNTKKFHYPSCKSAKQIKEKNYLEYTGNRKDLINNGYSPCKNCNP